jgi:glycyl-tRNA synthetase (class II)
VDVQTVGDEKAAADNKVTIRDRDTMEQVRVPIGNLETVMAELLTGQWSAVAGQHGIVKN